MYVKFWFFLRFTFSSQIWSHIKVLFITNPTVSHLYFSNYFWSSKIIFSIPVKKQEGRVGRTRPNGLAAARSPLDRPAPGLPHAPSSGRPSCRLARANFARKSRPHAPRFSEPGHPAPKTLRGSPQASHQKRTTPLSFSRSRSCSLLQARAAHTPAVTHAPDPARSSRHLPPTHTSTCSSFFHSFRISHAS
jgi:hypothetical protein